MYLASAVQGILSSGKSKSDSSAKWLDVIDQLNVLPSCSVMGGTRNLPVTIINEEEHVAKHRSVSGSDEFGVSAPQSSRKLRLAPVTSCVLLFLVEYSEQCSLR